MVKGGKVQTEQMFSGLHLKADAVSGSGATGAMPAHIQARCGVLSLGPDCDADHGVKRGAKVTLPHSNFAHRGEAAMSEIIRAPIERTRELTPDELETVSGGDVYSVLNNFSQTLESKDKLGNTRIQMSP